VHLGDLHDETSRRMNVASNTSCAVGQPFRAACQQG
jgi:hypothetical protein